MKRRSFLKNTGLAGILAAGSAPAFAQASPEVKWRLASSFPKSLDTIYGGAVTISERCASATNNKFQIQVFAAGEIVPAFGVVDAVQNATVQCAHTAPYYFFGKDPTFAFGCAIPFGMNARQQNAWMYHGGGRQLYNDFLKDYNIVSFGAGNTGAQMGGWFRKEIKTVADLKGLKFRIGGTGALPLQKLGVIPQQIPGGEIPVTITRPGSGATRTHAECVGRLRVDAGPAALHRRQRPAPRIDSARARRCSYGSSSHREVVRLVVDVRVADRELTHRPAARRAAGRARPRRPAPGAAAPSRLGDVERRVVPQRVAVGDGRGEPFLERRGLHHLQPAPPQRRASRATAPPRRCAPRPGTGS